MAAGRGQDALAFDVPEPPLAVPRERLRWLEVAALLYLIAISAGIFGFVDVALFGRDFEKTDESAFAQVLWPSAYLLFATLITLHHRGVTATAVHRWWVLPFPVLAAASVLWSIDQAATFDATVRIIATTTIGLYLGARFESGELARAVFLVLFLAVGASVVSGAASLGFAVTSEGTVRGVFHHKNTLGSRGALLVVVSLALLLAGWRPWLTLPGTVIGAIGTIWSSSASGLVLAAIAALAAPIALAARGSLAGMTLRLVAIGALASTAAFLLVLFRIDPLAEALQTLERDATLTGRVLLWRAALEHIALRPVLGAGFDAFWPGGLDWRMLGVLDRLGNVLHFHNSFVQVAVELGALGLLAAALHVLGYAVAALRALRRVRIPLWPVLLGVTVLALATVEHELFVKHNLFHILFVAVPVAALREVGASKHGDVASDGYARMP